MFEKKVTETVQWNRRVVEYEYEYEFYNYATKLRFIVT